MNPTPIRKKGKIIRKATRKMNQMIKKAATMKINKHQKMTAMNPTPIRKGKRMTKMRRKKKRRPRKRKMISLHMCGDRRWVVINQTETETLS